LPHALIATDNIAALAVQAAFPEACRHRARSGSHGALRTAGARRACSIRPDVEIKDRSRDVTGAARIGDADDAADTSTSAEPSRRWACSPVYPNFFRYSIALRQAFRYATVASMCSSLVFEV
jgi:hypothetical protein